MKERSTAARRLPKDMVAKKKRVPLSARVLEETASTLRHHARRNGLSLAELTAHVLDDYVAWLTAELQEQKLEA